MNSRVTERGQVTIPKELRERLGIRPGQIVEFTEEDGRLLLRRRVDEHPVDRVYGILASDRTSDEVMEELRRPSRERRP